jgi:hypothetical protein
MIESLAGRFPAPNGNGRVIVSYPFMLKVQTD